MVGKQGRWGGGDDTHTHTHTHAQTYRERAIANLEVVRMTHQFRNANIHLQTVTT